MSSAMNGVVFQTSATMIAVRAAHLSLNQMMSVWSSAFATAAFGPERSANT